MSTDSKANQLRQYLEQVLATAQAGLAYSTDRFDIERFRNLQRVTAEFMADGSAGLAPQDLLSWINLDRHYPTPKLDVRALILDNASRVLLVKEISDGLWTLPGGWCDVGESPSEAVTREVYEETGLKVRPIRLLALLDKLKHAHPPQLPHSVKAFFLCSIHGGTLSQQTDETSAAAYYRPDDLPELSPHRVLASQIQVLWAGLQSGRLETIFD